MYNTSQVQEWPWFSHDYTVWGSFSSILAGKCCTGVSQGEFYVAVMLEFK